MADNEEKIDVLFDVTKEMDAKYGNPTVQERLLESLSEAGITYEFTPGHVTLDEMVLDEYKILVIWDPEGTYSEAEIQAIHNFVEDGGILLFMGTSYFDTVQIVLDNLNGILSQYGIQVTKDRIIDTTDFFGCHCGTTPLISNFAEGSFFYNIDELGLRHTAMLQISEPAYAIAMGDDDAFIDDNLNEILDEGEIHGDLPVIAQRDLEGGGKVIVFGTEKIFEDTSITLSDNKKFAENMFSDLVSYADMHSNEDSSNDNYFLFGGVALAALLIVAIVAMKGSKKKD